MNILNTSETLLQGGVTITYTGRDSAGNPCHGTITVTPEDLPPVTGDDAATVTKGGTVSIDVLVNDTDPEGGPLTVTEATAEKGSVTVGDDGALSYTAPGETGVDTVTYQVRDSAGNVATGTVTITVTVVDLPPITGGDAATVTEGGTVSIDVLANDTDPEGGPLTVVEATAEKGSVTVEADGTLTYTAPIGFSGTDTVSYQVRDSAGSITAGTVTVAVEALDLPPEAMDDVASATAGETVAIEVLANDTDPEGGPLTVITAVASYGSVTINADNTLSYTAPQDYGGTDIIGYTISDSAGNTAEGQVTVGVDPVPNQPPVATDDTAAVATPGGTVTIDVLANDTDPEGGPLTVTEATAEKGSVTVGDDGKLAYTAPTGFSGIDTVTYTIRDAGGATDQGQVEVTVTPVQLVIDQNTTVGDFAIEAGSGDITVTILEPADYAGTHVIQTADLAQGPINLVPARIEGGTTTGSTLSAVPGIWAGDETHGQIDFAQQWYRGTSPAAGATDTSYAIKAGDATSGLHYSRQASNAAGSRSVMVEALPVTPTTGQPFAERGVRFTAPARLVRNANLAPADSQNVLWFVSLVPHATGRQGILRQTPINNGVEIWDGKFQLHAANRLVDSRPLTVGQRAHFLATATGSGNTTVLSLFSRFVGESSWTAERSDNGGTGPVDLTFGGFSVGGRHGGNGHNLNATVYRIAFWSDVDIDLGDSAVLANFLNSDGTLVDPAVSRGLYGTPRVDLFGPAEDYAAGTNRGTAGNFDIIEGTFTNA